MVILRQGRTRISRCSLGVVKLCLPLFSWLCQFIMRRKEPEAAEHDYFEGETGFFSICDKIVLIQVKFQYYFVSFCWIWRSQRHSFFLSFSSVICKPTGAFMTRSPSSSFTYVLHRGTAPPPPRPRFPYCACALEYQESIYICKYGGCKGRDSTKTIIQRQRKKKRTKTNDRKLYPIVVKTVDKVAMRVTLETSFYPVFNFNGRSYGKI